MKMASPFKIYFIYIFILVLNKTVFWLLTTIDCFQLNIVDNTNFNFCRFLARARFLWKRKKGLINLSSRYVTGSRRHGRFYEVYRSIFLIGATRKIDLAMSVCHARQCFSETIRATDSICYRHVIYVRTEHYLIVFW